MYQHILVAVDGSSASDRALQEAVKLAREFKSRLRILVVVEPILLAGEQQYIDYNEIHKAVVGYGRDVLKKAADAAQKAGIEAETTLVESKGFGERVADVIAHEADARGADLIVIGTHGRRGFNHLLMGSVAERVARIATKPVLLIREK
ncbi:MAG: universal stress protein [Bacteroidota bacterium]